MPSIALMPSVTYPYLQSSEVHDEAHLINNPWWETFRRRMSCSHWQHPRWNHTSHHCHALLLSSECVGFCCENGSVITPSLPPLPPHILSICNDHYISPCSHRLNSLFSFTAIGASKGLERFRTGLWNVAITGCTYH